MSRALDHHLVAAHGLLRRIRLLDAGLSPRAITTLVQHGTLTVPRRGWLATPQAPPRALAAVRLGGRLGGASALASRGIWVDEEPELIVSYRPSASKVPTPGPGVRRVWIPEVATEVSACEWRVSTIDALVQLAHCARRETLVASVDSALEKKALSRAGLVRLLAALPTRLHSIQRDVDGTAMSGTETHMRLALRRRGHRVETQVDLPGIGIVDLLVDGWLIVELDSRGHHGGEENQIRDRRRDGNSVLGRFGHERFMWSQVFYDLEWCIAVVEARLQDGAPARKYGSGR